MISSESYRFDYDLTDEVCECGHPMTAVREENSSYRLECLICVNYIIGVRNISGPNRPRRVKDED